MSLLHSESAVDSNNANLYVESIIYWVNWLKEGTVNTHFLKQLYQYNMVYARFLLNYLLIKDISFLIEFFKYKNINNGVIFNCNSGTLSNVKMFNEDHIKISGNDLDRINFNDLIIPHNYHKVGIVLNTSCNGWANILAYSKNMAYFKSPFTWVILTENLPETINTMSQYNLDVDSDVTIAYDRGKSFDLFEIFNTGFGQNGVFVDRKIGFWNKTLHLKKEHRRDLHGLILRSVVVINQNQKVANTTFLRYLETERPSLTTVDPMHKFKFFEVLKYIGDMYNISYEFQRSNSWGYPTNGSFDGMMGALQRLEADIAGSPMFVRTDRAKAVDYAAETWQTRPCFIFRHPKHPGGLYTIYTRPLTSRVWYCILALMVLSTTVLSFMLKLKIIKIPGDEEDASISLAFLFIWSALCQQGMSIARSTTSIQIVVFVIFIHAITLYQYYNATVVSTLLREPPKNIRTMDDLIKSNLKAGIEDVLYNKDFFKRTTDPLAIKMYHKKISTATAYNFFPSEVGMAMVKRGGFAFHVDSAVAYRLMRLTFSERETCAAQEISMFVPQFLGVAVTKRSPYREHFASAIRKLKESGIMHRLRYQWDSPRPACVRTPDSSVISVSVREFSTALIVLSGGYVLSVLVLCCELLARGMEGRLVEFRH